MVFCSTITDHVWKSTESLLQCLSQEKDDCVVKSAKLITETILYIIHESILQFPSILENNFPVSGEPSYLYSITLELTKPWTFERAVRSQSIAQSSGTSYSLGILSRKTLPKVC